jgi:predicted permease
VRSIAFPGAGVTDPDQIRRVSLASGPFVRVSGDSATLGDWAFSNYVRLTDDVPAMVLVAAVPDSARYGSRREGDRPLVSYRAVTGNYFGVLGLRTELGRFLQPGDDQPQVRNAVVSSGFWRNMMGADDGVLGRTIVLNDQPFTIVGVADRRFSGPPTMRQEPSFWITATAHREMWTNAQSAEALRTRRILETQLRDPSLTTADRARLTAIGVALSAKSRAWNPAVEVFGRLRPGASAAQAETELRTSASRQAVESSVTQAVVVALEPAAAPKPYTTSLAALLLTIVGLVVLLACANVTNVLLASAAGRRREIGTRLAIGASRGRVVRQLLTESMMLGVAASAVGVLIAIASVSSLSRLLNVPVAVDVAPDPTVYAGVALVTVVIGVLAGLAPARYGGGGDITTSLKVDQLTAPLPLPRARLRSLLVGGQAAISVVLLVLAALLTRSLADSMFVDVGFDIDRVLTANVSTAGAPKTGADHDAHWGQMREQVLAVPGVAGAAFGSLVPFDFGSAPQQLNGVRVSRNETTPEYFETLGIRTLRGRIYSADEMRTGAAVVVISASLARAFWGTDDPLGDGMERVWGPVTAKEQNAGIMRKVKDARIIGIVEDVTRELKSKNAPTIYLPLSASAAPRLVVRMSTDRTGGMNEPLRDAIQRFDPRQRPTISRPLDGLQRELQRPTSLAMLAIVVGSIALGLAVIGLFGVTAFVVEQRTHEMSVRRALGATSRQLIELMLRENLRPVAIGIVVGLLAAFAGGRVIQSTLYGTSSRDPLALVAAILVLLTAATLAVLIPARKAGRVDPVQLLKQG